MAEKEVDKLLAEFKKHFNAKTPDVAKCKPILSKMKISMINFQLTPPFTLDENIVKKQLLLARETLELATFLSLVDKDEAAFERHLNQVKTYYTDYAHLLPSSERKWPIMGLQLMFLLSDNRIADFHTELELMSLDDQKNLYVAYPIDLEKRLMEGSYNKVLAAGKSYPHPYYQYFMEKLVFTVRDKLADCTQAAYSSFPVAELSSLLNLPKKELAAFCKDRDWDVSGGKVNFGHAEEDKQDGAPSFRLITESLEYATELERIV